MIHRVICTCSSNTPRLSANRLWRFMIRIAPICFAMVIVTSTARPGDAVEDFPAEIEERFAERVAPFLKAYCYECHGTAKQEAKLDLSRETTVADVVKNERVWELVIQRLNDDEMPPKESVRQPPNELRRSIIDWAISVRDFEAARHEGDPGRVLARRLSNAEFDNTIRDLTGVDIRPTREFPVDPANEAGFDNSGESLSMSPSLVKKYFAAARSVADHLVLLPQGFAFAAHPVVTETDRDKYCVRKIVDFYQRHDVDLADYFLAAWKYYHRGSLGRADRSLEEIANESRSPKSKAVSRNQPEITLSPKYLATVWSALTQDEPLGPMAEVQAEWQRLIADQSLLEAIKAELREAAVVANERSDQPQNRLRHECERLRDLVLNLRKDLDPKIEKLHVKGNSDGSQPLILWWNRQIAMQRIRYTGDGKDPALDEARAGFCRVFPNAFAVSSRGHYADAKLGAELRLLTAGFHLMQGYFRDDEPLCELVLIETQRSEIDALWQNLNFITLVPYRQYKDFLFFERAEPPRFAGGPEFDFARPEDKDVTSEPKLTRMRDAYIAKATRNNASNSAIEAIQAYFANMSTDLRWIEKTQQSAIQSHLDSLLTFAERAYRRPLNVTEREELLAFYQNLRTGEGLNHEDAIRDSIASVLMSPYFCFRFDLSLPGEKIRSLNSHELASRLSYFLWSSMPDDKLLAHARQGDLTKPETMVSEAKRMLGDARIRGLATEFAGNWLDFRRFEEHQSVDRERFPVFTNELRQAMYEEPVRFFIDVASKNRSVLDFLDAPDTFVNPVLAKHYGLEKPTGAASDTSPLGDTWYRITDAGRYGRGGLPTMAVFLTKNSPGLRTSPVKRGYWIVRRLLGEHIPSPPPAVPELPKDETSLGELTLPQVLARHREHQACAGCHQKFDFVGLAFEGFGPVGERRKNDLAGHPVQNQIAFPDGSEGVGVEALRSYLVNQRRDDFVDNLCRKLFSFALGRTLVLSDKITLNKMKSRLADEDYRFESLIESIVTSPQFLTKRGTDDADEQ